MTGLKVGVIIPFYGGSKYLPQLLESIQVAEGIDLKIFVIDNSRKEEKLNTREKGNVNATIINAPAGIGYGRACNIGYKECIAEKRDIAVVVNQDGYFAPGSLNKLIDFLDSQQEFTAAVPLLTEYNSKNVEPFFTHVYLTPMPQLVSDLFRGTLKDHYETENLCGACFAIKLSAYQRVPYLFDELYKMYFEDGDLFIRMKRMNQKVAFLPSAVFHHQHTNTKDSLQTIRSLSVKRTSKHIYTLKNTGSSFTRAFCGWMLLEFRSIIEHLLKGHFRTLLVEFISCFVLFGKIKAIRKSRKGEVLLLSST